MANPFFGNVSQEIIAKEEKLIKIHYLLKKNTGLAVFPYFPFIGKLTANDGPMGDHRNDKKR